MSAATTGADATGMLPVDWICNALDRDRSHVMVIAIAPTTSSASAPALLTQRLAGAFEVVTASLAGLEPDAALARILGERKAWGTARLEAGLQRRVEALTERGSALVLVLPDVASTPVVTLRRLGRLAAASRQGLRLALFIDCTAAEVDAAAAELVCNLGIGMEKIVVGLRATDRTGLHASSAGGPTLETPRAASEGPPRIEPEPVRWWAWWTRWAGGAAIRVRSRGRRRRSHAAGWAGFGFVVALQVAWWSSPMLERALELKPARVVAEMSPPPVDANARRMDPPRMDPPRMDLPHGSGAGLPRVDAALDAGPWAAVLQPLEIAVAEPVGSSAAHVPALVSSTEPPAASPAESPRVFASESPPAPLAEPHAGVEDGPLLDTSTPAQTVAVHRVERAPKRPVRAATPVVRKRTIPVNLNADPWAHVELDGRSIGTTPLANVPMKPGSHRVVVRFPDGHVVERTVEIDGFSRYFRFP